MEVAPTARWTGLAIAALLLTGCTVWIDHFVFFPDRRVGPPPAGVEERWIATEDGRRLHAWYLPPRDGGPVLLWSHGNAGNIDSRRALLLALGARAVGVLAYDYRGYGRSDGSPSESGVYLDASAVFDDLVARGTDPATIVCFGESLGGAVSIEVATRRRCGAVIAVSTFTRLADVARRHYGPLGSLAGNRFDSLARIPRVSAPILVAHGDQDGIVPFELGERLFAAAPSPKRFFRIAGADHNDALGRLALLDAIGQFAREAVTRRPPA
ncbi:MAG: alpha/beta hydrolase [Candidatus Rokuibacteriota bacterium]